MAQVDGCWADRIRAGDRRALERQFRHEADELRHLLARQAKAVNPAWRDFRRFLADVGPSPGPAYKLVCTTFDGQLGAETACWALQASKLVEAPPVPPPSPRSSHSQWTMVAGMPVPFSELPDRFGVPLAALSGAAGAGCSIEELIARASEAQADGLDLTWFSKSVAHQKAFRDAYLAWRLKIPQRHRAAATPQFLYIFIVSPTLALCKATLVDAGFWAPAGAHAQAARDASTAWRRFNELAPKAAAVLAGLEAYRSYSLTDDIAELSRQVTADERRMRTSAPDARAAVQPSSSSSVARRAA